MGDLELNKIAAAFLAAGIAYSGLGIVADNLSHPKRLDHQVLKIEGVAEAPTSAAPRRAAAAAGDRAAAGQGRPDRGWHGRQEAVLGVP